MVSSQHREFLHQLLQPYHALARRCASNDLVGPATNDVVAAATALSVTAAHFVEVKGLAPDTGEAEELQKKLKDVADTSKHGALRDPARTVTFGTALAYEVNDQNQFRFLRTELIASNGRVGNFDLVSTLARYIATLNTRMALGFNDIEPTLPLQPFVGAAGAIITHNTFEVGATRIRTYKRAASGDLELTNVPSFIFTVR
jgi:hypothetical protein